MTETQIEAQLDRIDVAQMLNRPPVEAAVCAMLIELARAEKIHPVWPDGVVNQTSIMVGEAGEALRAANHLREGRLTEGGDSMVALKQETIQTGAMAIRLLVNLEVGK